MKLVKVAAATLNQTPLAWDANLANAIGAMDEARARGVGILCLPELCLTGYGCEDAFLAPWVHERALGLLDDARAAARGLVVSVGLPVLHAGAVFNASALLVDGQIAGLVCKHALAGDGVHYEPRWFKPWPRGAVARFRLPDGSDVAIGDLVFDLGGVRLGFEICEDAWIAERPGASLARRGADVILNPSASHFAFGKHEIRRRLALEGSRAFGVAYVYANLLGNEAGRIVYDGDALIASAGEIVAEAPRFSFADRQLIEAVVDLDLQRARRAGLWSYQPSVTRDEGIVPVAFRPATASLQKGTRTVASFEATAHVKEEEFARAIALGLFDYLRKSRMNGFVVSLSGGADSAAVACLVALAVALSCRELGREAVVARLRLEGAVPANDRALVHALLTTAYQATRNSGDVTRAAARAVAEGIGSRHLELDVDGIVQAYTALVAGGEGRALDWQGDDLALQNIQARARAPGVWLIANLRGALLLATSNRSEAAVGYATMDGDTAGGLSPIAGIDKAFLRRWLVWLQSVGPTGLAPIPALAAVTVQAPTAELRPPSAHQTDEDDLMPYDVLDLIERLTIRDRRGPAEVWRVLAAERPDVLAATRLQWLERFFRAWSRNQWKRERYAPSFHVDDESLDPKTWCRFPILSGGFERELSALRAEVQLGR